MSNYIYTEKEMRTKNTNAATCARRGTEKTGTVKYMEKRTPCRYSVRILHIT